MTIKLFDISGRVVHAEQVRLLTGTTHQLRLSERLAHGTYTLQLSGPAGSSEQRVIVK